MIKFVAKSSSSFEQKAPIFSPFFGVSILKIVTSVPDWPKFRHWGKT
jgi:hypothetical protein